MNKIVVICLISIAAFAEGVYTTFDVKAFRVSELSMTSTGIVKKVNVDVGSRVKKGDVLLELDNDELKLMVDVAKEELKLAEVDFEFAKKSFERYTKVREVINDDLFEQHQSKFQLAQVKLTNAKINLAYRQEKLEKSYLFAPYSGLIASKNVEIGDGVNEMQMKSLFQLIDSSKVKLLFSYDEKYWQKVKVGSRVTYTVDGAEGSFDGKISKIYPTIDPKTRKATAEVIAKGFIPGLFGQGTIEAE